MDDIDETQNINTTQFDNSNLKPRQQASSKVRLDQNDRFQTFTSIVLFFGHSHMPAAFDFMSGCCYLLRTNTKSLLSLKIMLLLYYCVNLIEHNPHLDH